VIYPQVNGGRCCLAGGFWQGCSWSFRSQRAQD